MGTNTATLSSNESAVEPSTISWNRERSSDELKAFISRRFATIDVSDE